MTERRRNNFYFCCVCFLFYNNDSWATVVENDLKHLKINKPKNNKKLKNDFVSFQRIGKTNISASLSIAHVENIRIV